MRKSRFAILWRGVVLGEECDSLIRITSMRQLKQWALAYENDPCVDDFMLWDREENLVSRSADPIEWEDEPENFEEEWSDVKTA